jgi:hypothetical protein
VFAFRGRENLFVGEAGLCWIEEGIGGSELLGVDFHAHGGGNFQCGIADEAGENGEIAVACNGFEAIEGPPFLELFKTYFVDELVRIGLLEIAGQG